MGADKEKPAASELDLSGVVWHKSPEDDGEEGSVEIAYLADGNVAMRSSEEPDGPVLVFTAAEWDAFVEGVKDGEFDDLTENIP